MFKKRLYYFFGLCAEYYVAFIFFFKGYILIKHRYKTKLGEIDLIFEKNKTIIAVEVKARENKNVQIGEVVSNRQLKRICNSLKIFLNKYNKYSNFNARIDIVLVRGNLLIEHIKNIWVD